MLTLKLHGDPFRRTLLQYLLGPGGRRINWLDILVVTYKASVVWPASAAYQPTLSGVFHFACEGGTGHLSFSG